MCVFRSAARVTLALVFAAASSAAPQVTGDIRHPAPLQIVATATGLAAHNERETLELTVCDATMVHVAAYPAAAASSKALRPWILDSASVCPGAPFRFGQSGAVATLTTASLAVSLDAVHGSLTFRTAQGDTLIRENPSLPRSYGAEPAQPPGTYRIEDRFWPSATDAVYGLGQHQSGMFNYRGSVVELAQNNTDVAIPLLVSSKGYALFWNTASASCFDNRFPRELNLSAAASDGIDYYFFYGPAIDSLVHQYRTLTGHVPLFPEWAYGFFQSKDRYSSQNQLLAIAHEYRARHIPLDAIVQDWFWWKRGGEGDPVFNSGYPDVPAALKTLHDEHVHAMISVWALMDATSNSYRQMQDRGFEIPGTHVYDATNPSAGDFYWSHLAGKLFAQGWDAFWLDSSEPEEYWPHVGDAILRYRSLQIGSGLQYTNIFPFEHTAGVAAHWKQAHSGKRVYLLTRSAFAGQQRNGATVWSGDVYTTWWALRRQVPAGLNFALSGYPYWTTDIGGYEQPWDGFANTPAYRELYARWFEYGAFCPIFRTHGHRDHNELWTWGDLSPDLIAIDRLRYRLLPYIYSLAWRVTQDDYTIQRPLVMDFAADAATHDLGDQFMFGPALLVSPVLVEHATTRSLYLPGGASWYDFWTGKRAAGGAEIQASAPIGRIPLDVRAGSILPLGPVSEYAGQAHDPIELRIYPGAGGSFSLYEDEGDGYGYEQGAHAVIPIRWDDASRILTIGARQGSYPGMASAHTFNVVLVSSGHGIGSGVAAAPDKVLHYTGAETRVRF